MLKRLLSALLSLALTALSVRPICAEAVFSLCELANCRVVRAYSGCGSAYFYGFSGGMLVSSRVIPDAVTRTVSVSGSILSACHDDSHACALVRAGLKEYRAVVLDMDSGAWTEQPIDGSFAVQHSSVAYADGEFLVIAVSDGVSYVHGCCADRSYDYRFPANIDGLFVRDNAAYARLDGGAVWRLGGGTSSFCADGAAQTAETLSSAGTLTVCADGMTAVLHADCTCTVSGGEAPQEVPQTSVSQTGDILTVACGTTVSGFKTAHADVLAVTDADGNNVGSGKLRTGYAAQLISETVLLAVTGDLDGSGTVSGRDTAALMQYFAGGSSLTACMSRAADMNGDGSLDNCDLVLMARAAGADG